MIFPAVSVSLLSPICEMTFIIMTMRFYTPTIGVWDGFEPKVVTGEDDDEEFTDEETKETNVVLRFETQPLSPKTKPNGNNGVGYGRVLVLVLELRGDGSSKIEG